MLRERERGMVWEGGREVEGFSEIVGTCFGGRDYGWIARKIFNSSIELSR